VAAKKIANKAAKAAKKIAKPVAKKLVAAKSAVKPVTKVTKAAAVKPQASKTAPAKSPPAKKAPAQTASVAKAAVPQPTKKTVAKSAAKTVVGKASPAAAKPAATKSAPKPATKPAAVKSVPVKAVQPAPPPVRNPVPVSKSSAKTPAKSESTAKPAAARPVGKVAVAVTSKTTSPAPRNTYKQVQYEVDESTARPVLPAGYKPSHDEEYMSALQQEYFRQRLQQWRADLVEESKQTIENLREEVRDIGDEAERATRETENSLELRTRDRYRKLIGKIDSTLKRLDAGDYGYCVDTGEEIGLERLDARLTAERTIDAQERWEHMQKQQGD
jgi:DnaK suppressor protein